MRYQPIDPQLFVQHRANLARLLGVLPEAVNVKAKTGEGVGHIGRAEAIGCHAVILIERP